MNYPIFLIPDRCWFFAQVQPSLPGSNSSNNPLIDHTGEKLIYLGILLLVISGVIVFGLISKKLKYALIFALTLSAILIPFLWML